MIELRNIYKFIDGHKILDNLSLKFNEREMVCLIGPMGGGKSTLLRCIAGLVEPDAGEVVYTSGQLLSMCLEWRWLKQKESRLSNLKWWVWLIGAGCSLKIYLPVSSSESQLHAV